MDITDFVRHAATKMHLGDAAGILWATGCFTIWHQKLLTNSLYLNLKNIKNIKKSEKI